MQGTKPHSTKYTMVNAIGLCFPEMSGQLDLDMYMHSHNTGRKR